jgi:O-antigen/teichoic acid export membrane protein
MTTANAAVAGLGFLGSGLLLPSGLDAAAFAAASLFLAAFQCLQEVMGRSLNWALLRLHPVAARERDGGGDQMLATAWALQRRLIAAGCVVAAALAAAAHWLIDQPGEPSRALVLGIATLAAMFGVLLQFELGVLQLRERFLALSSWMVANSAARLFAWTMLWALGLLSLATAIAAHIVTAAAIALSVRRAAGPLPALLPGADAANDRARLLHFGGRMVLATALASTAAQVDLFLLDARADDVTTGRLRIAVLFATVLELATSAVMTALLPQAGRAHDAAARRAMLRHSARWGLAVASLALLSLPVVTFALPRLLPHYASAVDLYPIVLLGVVLTALTDPLGLTFISRDRPGRFIVLNALLLLVVVLGNLFVEGDDRAQVTAWVRTAGRATLALGIVLLVLRDRGESRATADATC